jgi:hypothetical protein
MLHHIFFVNKKRGANRPSCIIFAMFAGHFGLAAAVKAKAPEVPLWALMVGTQLLDLAFMPLLLSGIETMDQTSHGSGYGQFWQDGLGGGVGG